MMLALDVGNSAVKGGLFDGPDLRRVFSISIDAADRADLSSATAWEEALSPHLADVSIARVGIASVVPTIAEGLADAVSQRTEAPLTRIQPSLSLPFDLAYETPETLGTDRLAAAAAGWVLIGQAQTPPRSVLVVDAGTAVTCEVVHRDGVYQGGTITAGPRLIRQALQSGTAQLPEVPLRLPGNAVGQSTQTALQSGIMWSLIDGVQAMTNRLAGELPDAPRVALTGGWAPLLSEHLEGADHHPHLVLRGIRVLVREETA